MKYSGNESKMSVVWTALRAARTLLLLLLLLEAGDLTETVEDNRDDDEPACGEGGGRQWQVQTEGGAKNTSKQVELADSQPMDMCCAIKES